MNALTQPWHQAINYWQELSKREQYLSMAGGIAIGIWLLWQGAYQPLVQRQEQAAEQLAASQQLLQTMQQQADRVRQLQKGQPNKARLINLPLDRMVNQTARSSGINLTGVRAQQESLHISLDTVSFEKLLAWLVVMDQQGGASVREIDIKRTEKSGYVDVESLRIYRG